MPRDVAELPLVLPGQMALDAGWLGPGEKPRAATKDQAPKDSVGTADERNPEDDDATAD